MIVEDAPRPGALAEVAALVEACREHDGALPLDEPARLALQGGSAGEGIQHRLVHAGPEDQERSGALLGYASILSDGTVQGAVHPRHRRRGIGSALLEAVLARRSDAGVWVHGDLPGSLAFLRARGLEVVRELLTMHRPLTPADASLEAEQVPGVRLIAFSEADDQDAAADAWVRVNARAFADHPEQGRLTRADFEERRAQSWFDPAGLHLAIADGQGRELLGFVWTKREQGAADGELYAVATDPDAGGRGIARALITTALRGLARSGTEGVELYVEGSSTGAIRLYERLGFAVSGRDMQLRLRDGVEGGEA